MISNGTIYFQQKIFYRRSNHKLQVKYRRLFWKCW